MGGPKPLNAMFPQGNSMPYQGMIERDNEGASQAFKKAGYFFGRNKALAGFWPL